MLRYLIKHSYLVSSALQVRDTWLKACWHNCKLQPQMFPTSDLNTALFTAHGGAEQEEAQVRPSCTAPRLPNLQLQIIESICCLSTCGAQFVALLKTSKISYFPSLMNTKHMDVCQSSQKFTSAGGTCRCPKQGLSLQQPPPARWSSSPTTEL